MRRFLALIAIFLLVFGCLGLKEESDCQKPKLREPEKIACYHQAAVSAAYGERTKTAKELCENIYFKFGIPNKGNDISKRAETERNLCLFDIAKIIARQPKGESIALSMCSGIDQDTYKTTLVGASITKKMCESQVKRIADIRPKSYYEQGKVNICSIIFILPLILFAIWKQETVN